MKTYLISTAIMIVGFILLLIIPVYSITSFVVSGITVVALYVSFFSYIQLNQYRMHSKEMQAHLRSLSKFNGLG